MVRPAVRKMTYPKLMNLVVVLILTGGSAAFAVGNASAQDLPGELYSLSGNVTNNMSSEALEDAKVVLRPSGGGEARTVLTGPDGAYEFAELAAGIYNVTASHGCCTSGFAQVDVGGTQLEHVENFPLEPQPEPTSGDPVLIHGVVFDRATNEPVPNAYIQISNYFQPATVEDSTSSGEASPDYYYEDGYQWFNVVSAEDGSWSLNVNAGTVDIWVEHESYDYTRGSFNVKNDTEIDIPMRPAEEGSVVLHGVLKSTDGKALQGWISVSPDYSSRCDGDVCTMQAEPAYGSEPSSQGGFWFEPRGDRYGHAETEEDGSWSIRTFPGNLRVYANAHYDYNQEYLPAEKRIEAEAGDNVTVDLRLTPIPPDSVKVTGKVTDQSDGAAVPYASVSAQNQKWGTYNSTMTDEDGTFEIWVKPGYVVLEVRAWERYWTPCEEYDIAEDSSAPSSGKPMIARSPQPYCEPQEREHAYFPRVAGFVVAEDDAKSLDFALARFPKPDATFVGWVVNATSNQGVEGAVVTFYNERTRDWGQATTDANGSYRIDVHAGYYTVRAYAEGYFDGVLNTEIESGDTKKLDVMMEPGQKRWGYCCWGYYDAPVAMESASVSHGAGSADFEGEARDSSASNPGGAQAYEGEAGGLGPYDPAADLGADGGDSPGFGAVLAAAALAASLVLTRRRRD